MVLFALGLHAVLKYYNAPADADYSQTSTFAATFTSTTFPPSLRGSALRLSGREERSQKGRAAQVAAGGGAERDRRRAKPGERDESTPI